jgi:hypothetical protein
MKDFLSNKERYYNNFIYVVYRKFKELRYGISMCRSSIDEDLALMRKELIEWLSCDDNGALSDVNISYTTWLPITYTPQQLKELNCNIPMSKGFVRSYTTSGPTTVGMNYQYANGEQNVVQVNTGGCITKINLNPTININTNIAFQYHQATPNTIWTIPHNLGYVPNVWETDLDGNTIEGIVEVIDNNNIIITFNTAVAGTAYLS